MRGTAFVPLHKVDLASHICHGKFGEVWGGHLTSRRWCAREPSIRMCTISSAQFGFFARHRARRMPLHVRACRRLRHAARLGSSSPSPSACSWRRSPPRRSRQRRSLGSVCSRRAHPLRPRPSSRHSSKACAMWDSPANTKDLLDRRSFVYYALILTFLFRQRRLIPLPISLLQHTPGLELFQCLVIHTGAVGEGKRSTAGVRRRSQCRASSRYM
jgi:hypothetical protein